MGSTRMILHFVISIELSALYVVVDSDRVIGMLTRSHK